MSVTNFPDFRLQRETELPAVRAVAREFEHVPSGARLIHLASDDPENCFALIFPTPPNGNHGVPHILEHAVLTGSEQFPVREPFFEMIKSSPAGFINAMTSDLWTVYPICTTLAGDFFNLADVYVDAVFHPLLTKDTFEREGHHLKLETAGDTSSALIRSGIVYNEMKGAYSDSEAVLNWRLKGKLFPGSPLGFDAGGDPVEIPQLTWEALRHFHGEFYAPGNCTLLLYGDIPTEKHLEYWGPKLSGLGHAPSLARRPKIEKWSTPQTIEQSYGAEPGADLSGSTYLSLRWHCGDALDPVEGMAWTVLTRLLSGHDAAPLKKALIASKLGADVFEAGVEPVESELSFHIALKGSERDRAAEFQEFVLRTLQDIVDTGFSAEDIATAIRQTAYETLEVHPLYPLHLAMDAARYAATGADPLEATRAREALDEVRAASATDGEFFTRRIQQGLIDNTHRLLTVLYPDPEHGARQVAEEQAALAEIKATLSEAELKAIDEHAQELEKSQGEPNPPEALATLPRLGRGDLPEVPREIPTSVGEVAGFTFLRNDVFSNGVVYLHAAVDIRDLPAPLWKYVPRYGDAFEKMGAAGQSWEQIAARRAASTGDLGGDPIPFLLDESGNGQVDFRFKLKTLDADIDSALDLFQDLLFNLDPSDRPRLHEMQTQGVIAYRDSLVNNGLGAALKAASLPHSPIGRLGYLWESPLTYSWMRYLTEEFNDHAEELMAGIEAVRDFLLQNGRWTWSFTGSDASLERIESRLTEWAGRMRSGGPAGVIPTCGTDIWDGARDLPKNLGLAAPLDVQFCARVHAAPAREIRSLVELGTSLLNFDYLLPEIRFKGNAYGGGSRLDFDQGTYSYFSYRDPHLNQTLRVFDSIPDWVRQQDWTADDLERALLGNVKDAVPAIRPGTATGAALHRHRRGENAQQRAERYQAKLAATPAQVKQALADYLDAATPTATTAVASSRAALEKANAERSEALVIEEMLPASEGK